VLTLKDLIDQVERVISEDRAGKGIGRLIMHGDMERAAYSLFKDGQTVFITTGFHIKGTGVGTDGPAGAVALAMALRKLGKNAVLVVDGPNIPMIQCALDAVSVDMPIVLFPISGREAFAKELLIEYRPSHIVALERIGPASDGRYYDKRGIDISDGLAPIDLLFTVASDMGIVTIGMGDDGNEIGMGKVYKEVIENIDLGESIACTVSTDYLIVSGVSNWAAHGICACLSLMANEDLMMQEDLERKLLQALVGCGAIDSCTLRPEPTVDSLKDDEYFKVMRQLREIIGQAVDIFCK
jgi:hypothetical protein